VRVSDGFPAEGTILQIRGQFLSIDEGNRTQRVVIGLGRGRSDVRAAVQVYETLEEGRTLVAHLEADAKSGCKPGAAETMGVSAAVGAATATAATAAGSAGSEIFGTNVEADAKRMARGLARQLGEFFVNKGWMDRSALPSVADAMLPAGL